MAVRQRLPDLIRTLRRETIRRPTRQPLPSLRRAFSLYDQINLIDNVPEDQLRFQQYTDTGFTVNGVEYEGSLICVGNLLMSWSPKSFSEITPERITEMLFSTRLNEAKLGQPVFGDGDLIKNEDGDVNIKKGLSIFRTVHPIPEMLVLGCGRNIVPVSPELRSFVRSTGMKLEVLDSRNAASTYNILNEEGRVVAAAVIPYGVSS